VDKIFKAMDKNKDDKLTYAEFVTGSKQDPAIANVSPVPSRGMFAFPALTLRRQALSLYGGFE